MLRVRIVFNTFASIAGPRAACHAGHLFGPIFANMFDEMAQEPEQELANALLQAFRDDFSDRAVTAAALAELMLDAAEDALPLAEGAEAGPSLARLELLATRVDLYAWDGPPGWDEVLARGLRDRPPGFAGASPLDGVGREPSREMQRRRVEERARSEARNLIALGQTAAHPERADSPAAVLVRFHGSLLRLLALASVHALLVSPEDAEAGALPGAGAALLVAEIAAREAARSDFASAHEEWLGRLLVENPAAEGPAFRTFFAGLSQALRLAVALRRFAAEARAGKT
jgi:hypothetical protein